MRKMFVIWIVTLLLIGGIPGCIDFFDVKLYGQSTYAAGYTTRMFTYNNSRGEQKTKTLYLWYPCDESPTPYNYGTMTGNVVLNGTISKDHPFPLIVFSHGYKGNALQSLFITQKLAESGYVVAALNHDDAIVNTSSINITSTSFNSMGFTSSTLWNDSFFIDRKEDIQALLDEILELNNHDPLLNGFIDINKTGGMGHSLGGYTILGLTGGWPRWKDERISAALLFSPYTEPYRENGDLNNITLPIMLQGGTLDKDITPYLDEIYAVLKPPKYFLILRAATHMIWTNLACTLRNHTSIKGCYENCTNVKLIVSYTIAFFDQYLKNNPSASAYLHSKNPYLKSYKYSTGQKDTKKT